MLLMLSSLYNLYGLLVRDKLFIYENDVRISSLISRNILYSRSDICCSAVSNFSWNSCNSTVIYRLALTRVCLWRKYSGTFDVCAFEISRKYPDALVYLMRIFDIWVLSINFWVYSVSHFLAFWITSLYSSTTGS